MYYFIFYYVILVSKSLYLWLLNKLPLFIIWWLSTVRSIASLSVAQWASTNKGSWSSPWFAMIRRFHFHLGHLRTAQCARSLHQLNLVQSIVWLWLKGIIRCQTSTLKASNTVVSRFPLVMRCSREYPNPVLKSWSLAPFGTIVTILIIFSLDFIWACLMLFELFAFWYL